MSKKQKKTAPPPPKTPLRRRDPKELQTIAALKRMIRRMQSAGLIFILAGVLMPLYSPFFAEKDWKLLIGVSLPLNKVCIIAGCIMILVSIFCFLRSYRCPKCGGLLALTPIPKITKCRSCGVPINEKEHYLSKGDDKDA